MKMKRGDLWLTLLIAIGIAAAAFVWLGSGNEAGGGPEGRYARITVNGELYQLVDLKADAGKEIMIKTARGYNQLDVYSDGIRMHDADCPDQLCLSFGLVKRIGQTIVCLPNRVLVEIIGGSGEEGELDAVVT